MPKSNCPACQIEIVISENPAIGQRIICPACHEECEVVWLFPLELDFLTDTGTSLLQIDPEDQKIRLDNQDIFTKEKR